MFMTDTVGEMTRGTWSSAAWGGLLSLMAPGLGQVYAGSWHLGAVLFAISIVFDGCFRGIILAVTPNPQAVALVVVFLAFWLALVIGTAIEAVRRIRIHHDGRRLPWFHSTWLAAAVMLALRIGLDSAMPLGWGTFSTQSASNAPTLVVGDMVMADIRGPGALPVLGDMVLFKYPRDNSINFVKRIVGLPDNRVQMRQGQLYINGQLCPREGEGDYITVEDGVRVMLRLYRETLPNGAKHEILKATDEGEMNNTQEYLVPPDHMFTLGDNRDNSVDSRIMNGFGFVPVKNLVGRAEVIYFSADAEYPWWEFWWWPLEIRWSRLLMSAH
jgi:signal peptidase I